MKRYWPIIVASAVPVLILIGLYVTAPASEAARAQLERDIDRELAKARRLLDGYRPGEQLLLASQRRLTDEGAPFEANEARLQAMSSHWDGAVSRLDEEGSPVPPPRDLQEQLNSVNNGYRGLAGEEARPQSAQSADDASSAREQINEWLQKNDQRLTDAIQIVDAALAMSTTSDDQTYSGNESIEANRLRAILAYHYAESLGRTALFEQGKAENLGRQLRDLHHQWVAVSFDLAVAEAALTGGPSAAAASGPTTRAAAPRTPATRTADTVAKTATRPANRGGAGNLLNNLLGALTGRKPAATPAPAPAGDAAAPATAPSAEAEQPIPVEPLPQRIATLEKEKAATEDRIAKRTEELRVQQAAFEELSQRIEARRAEAAAAERRMAELEKQGFDPAQPETLRKHIEEYEAASRKSREATRIADRLESGGYTNALLISPTEDWHAARVVPANTGEKLSTEKSARQYRQEIETLRGILKAEQNRLGIINNRLSMMQTMKADFQVRLTGGPSRPADTQPAAPGLVAQRDAIVKQAKELASAILAASTEAGKLRDEAIAELKRGIEAVDAAQRAVDARQSQARSESTGTEPNPRLQRIEQETWRKADLDALLGDLQLLLATIHVERSRAAERLQNAAELAADCGAATDPLAAGKAIESERAAALAAAKAALEAYQRVESDLKKEWTFHMSLAAAQYLLSQLTPEAEAQQHRAEARKEYQAGIAGDEKNPDRRPFVERLRAMEKAQAEPKG